MNYLLYCKSHKCEGDKMHTVQKEACCIFFFCSSQHSCFIVMLML